MSELPRTAEELCRTMSISRAEMFARCQFQFFQRYVLGLTRAPSAYLALGNATDTTAESFYAKKKESGENLPQEDVAEMWRGEWGEKSREVEDLVAAERELLTRKGVLAITRWREKIAVALQPTEIKLWFELLIGQDKGGDGWTLNGEVDVVARPAREEHRLPIPCDTKMSSKRWDAGQAFSSMQPAIYGLALDHSKVAANTGLFQFHVAILYDPDKKRKDTDPAQIITRRVSIEEKNGALARLAIVRGQIARCFESGDWLPNRANVMCTRRHCGYWQNCERAFGPRVPD